MKKALLFIVAACGMLTISCQKERTCTCVTTIDGLEVSSTIYTFTDTKPKAQDACDAYDEPLVLLPSGEEYETQCDLD